MLGDFKNASLFLLAKIRIASSYEARIRKKVKMTQGVKSERRGREREREKFSGLQQQLEGKKRGLGVPYTLQIAPRTCTNEQRAEVVGKGPALVSLMCLAEFVSPGSPSFRLHLALFLPSHDLPLRRVQRASFLTLCLTQPRILLRRVRVRMFGYVKRSRASQAECLMALSPLFKHGPRHHG